MTERRTTRRYDLTLPVVVQVFSERFLGRQTGNTRDISPRGLYFVVDENVEAGSELDITVTLPPEYTQGGTVSVRAVGRVVRVENRMEDHTPRLGVAAMIERYDIVRRESTSA